MPIFFSGPSVWDNFTQQVGNIPQSDLLQSTHVQESIIDNNSSLYTGNVAADSYFKTAYDAQVRTKLDIVWFMQHW